MKKVFLILLIGMVTSCVTVQREEFPTSQELVDIWSKERETGVKYYPYEGRFVTEKELDSLVSIEVDQAIQRMFSDDTTISE
jgi:hypothetical protein